MLLLWSVACIGTFFSPGEDLGSQGDDTSSLERLGKNKRRSCTSQGPVVLKLVLLETVVNNHV